MSTPGAARSTYLGSRSEKLGTLPERVSAATPITCGNAAGQLAYFHGVAYASSELPTAATTSAPLETAYATARASSFEYVSRLGSAGSRTAPKLRLTTLAPWFTAQRIAAASALSGIVPSWATTFATMSCEEKAMPTTPAEFRAPAISPATIVPWPSLSTHGLPPTKLFPLAICAGWKSGNEQSTPESMIATFTESSVGGATGQASKARS